jgi:hypothetical protein
VGGAEVVEEFVGVFLSDDWTDAKRYFEPEAWEYWFEMNAISHRLFTERQVQPTGPPRWIVDPEPVGGHFEVPMRGDPPGDELYRFTLLVEGEEAPDGRWLITLVGSVDQNHNFGCFIGDNTPTPCPPSASAAV